MSEMLTRKEVAARLGVSTRTVQNYVAKKKLRERRLPSGRGARSTPRYAATDVAAFVASGYSAGLR
ncbi:MAG: hypothetical protein JWM87_662 [Candidatus Eremiobacteraeota bacterium]|nr:hypothetical protein [Candidatus Eremiobacteraeota bacterium]